jgi:hypothetical protein
MESFYKNTPGNSASYATCPPLRFDGSPLAVLEGLSSLNTTCPDGCNLTLCPPWDAERVAWWKNFLELQPGISTVAFGEESGAQYWEAGRAEIGCKPWLKIDVRNRVGSIIVHRPPSAYYSFGFPWRAFMESYRWKMVVVGTEEDRVEFIERFGPVRYLVPRSALELAQWVAGADWFLGAQASVYGLALGLGVRCWASTDGRGSHSHWPGNHYGPDRPEEFMGVE